MVSGWGLQQVVVETRGRTVDSQSMERQRLPPPVPYSQCSLINDRGGGGGGGGGWRMGVGGGGRGGDDTMAASGNKHLDPSRRRSCAARCQEERASVEARGERGWG